MKTYITLIFIVSLFGLLLISCNKLPNETDRGRDILACYVNGEQYDKYNTDFVDNQYSPCNILPEDIPDTYGDGMSYVLESYIRMYETTKDKAYLIKFINETLLIMAWRNTNFK